MSIDNDDIWLASLEEIRRQVKHIADITGLGSQKEGQTRLFKNDEDDWQVKQAFLDLLDTYRLLLRPTKLNTYSPTGHSENI